MRNAIISELNQYGATTITSIANAIRADILNSEEITIWVTEEYLLEEARICLYDLPAEKRPQVRFFKDAPEGTANTWRLGLGDIEGRIREVEWHKKWREDQKRMRG